MTIEVPNLERVGPMFTPEMAAAINRNLERLRAFTVAIRDHADPLVQPIDHTAEADRFLAIGYTPTAPDEILVGDPVRVVGHLANGYAIVARADAVAAASMGAVGLAANPSTGTFDAPIRVIRRGVIRGFDTSAWATGTNLYVASGGGLTSTPPSDRIQVVGVVGVSDANDGTIYVVGPGGDGGVSTAPSGAAGGVLSGSYPNPGFAVDMATQAEADAADAVVAAAAATALASHAAAADPHTVYQREAEKDAANGYAGLSASSKLAGAQQVYGTGANTACEGNDSRLSDSRAPTGGAGGDLAGTYPNPTIANLAVTDAKVAAANKDGVAGTASMRTLGTGAQQAAAGNDSRLSDSRFPTKIQVCLPFTRSTIPASQTALQILGPSNMQGYTVPGDGKIVGFSALYTGTFNTGTLTGRCRINGSASSTLELGPISAGIGSGAVSTGTGAGLTAGDYLQFEVDTDASFNGTANVWAFLVWIELNPIT